MTGPQAPALPHANTLLELLRTRAGLQADLRAFTFLDEFLEDGRHGTELTLTYAELDRKARAIAARLQALGAEGKQALLLYPPGLDYVAAFFGCLYARVVAVPAYPPNPARLQRTLPRLQAIVKDAQADFALTTSGILFMAEAIFTEAPDLARLQWLSTDDVSEELARAWKRPEVTPATLAFLQYTSGSTGTPKGVMLTHRNLLHNEGLIHRAFGLGPDTRVLGWLPIYHDMGLIGNVLQPLYLGVPCILLSPLAFLEQPLRWLRALSHFRANTSGGPNFAYDLCVRKVTPAQREGLDLSSWEVAFSGAEPVRRDTLDAFARAYASAGFRPQAFYPCYGLAEASLIVSGGTKTELPHVLEVDEEQLTRNRAVAAPPGEGRALVGSGRGLEDLRVVIVEPESCTPVPEGQVGEVWVSGPSVAQGYWRQPEATERTFGARLKDSGEGPFLRTGDLAFLQGRELFITGRRKDLIILRGRNLYPHDLELTVERSHPALRPGCGTAFSVEVGTEERLVLVQELDTRQPVDTEALLATVRQALAEEHEVLPHALVLVKPGSVPKTSSGKLQRSACREDWLAGRLPVLAEWTAASGPASAPERAPEAGPGVDPGNRDVTATLRALLAARLRVAEDAIDPGAPITRLGLDSLAATELSGDVHAHLGVELPMSRLLAGPTLDELAAQVAGLSRPREEDSSRTDAAGTQAEQEHPLSHGQQSLWFLHRLAPESAAYNVANAVRVRGALRVDALRSALTRLVRRHPALRTSFPVVSGRPVQRIHPHLEPSFEAPPVSPEALAAELGAQSRAPFTLEHGPLLRVRLYTLSDTEHVLLVVVHHIISDLWSQVVLARELWALYAEEAGGPAARLPPLSLAPADHARWEARMLEGSEGEGHWRYWRQQLAGELPPIDLPNGTPRPPVQTYRGEVRSRALEAGLSARLRELSLAEGTTLYMTLLAAFQVLLHRYTGQEDLPIGCTAMGRSRAELAGVLGYLVNPVVLRGDMSGDPDFTTLLRRVRALALAAFEHQDYPFSLLVERLRPARDPSRSPLFQVMFLLYKASLPDGQELTPFVLGEEGGRVRLGGLELESLPVPQEVSHFDLTLRVAEVGGRLRLSFEYNTDLFEAPVIERMLRHLEVLLEGLAGNPGRRLSELPLLTADEEARVLREWNRTRREHPGAEWVHHAFEREARQGPERTAVELGEARLTYGELERRANQLAHALRRRGVGPDVPVALCMERSLELVLGVLGVLKAGGAYVPLDPAYPRERLRFMLEDTRAPVVLTLERSREQLPSTAAEVLCLDSDWARVAREPEEPPGVPLTPDNLVYVMYTSGSTGMPKGVAFTHRAGRNLLAWQREASRCGSGSRTLQFSSPSFDVSFQELAATLGTGGTLVLVSESLRREPFELLRLLEARRVERLFLPFVALQQLAEASARLQVLPSSLREIITAGEQLQVTPGLRDFLRRLGGCTLHNHYGPTESHVVTAHVLEGPPERWPLLPPIGRPIDNSHIFLLDRRLKPVPPGLPGELFIGGAGLARGYLGRPELTAERFLPAPWSDEPGARLYRTGDVARWRDDGSLEYLGRVDAQAKVRGFRVEPAEVEAVLRTYPGLREAVVVVREDVPGQKRLVGYVVPSASPAPEPHALKAHLAGRLPEYLVPDAFVCLEALPLTPSGKVSRRSLPRPEAAPQRAAYTPPATPTEEQVAALWREVLGVEQVGRQDDFFALGGQSLLATRVVSRLQEVFQLELPVRSVFEAPTLEALSRLVDSRRGAPSSPAPALAARSRRERVRVLDAQGQLKPSGDKKD